VEELSSGEEMKVEQWRKHLEEDLGVISIPDIDHTVGGQEDFGSESYQGNFSNQETESSSHEAGIEVVSEESEDDEEAAREAEERHAFITEPKRQKVINKGLRRKLGHHAREIRETSQQDSKAKKDMQKPSSHAPAKQLQSKFCQKRRWSVLEVSHGHVPLVWLLLSVARLRTSQSLFPSGIFFKIQTMRMHSHTSIGSSPTCWSYPGLPWFGHLFKNGEGAPH
jgi:hypothetical protein